MHKNENEITKAVGTQMKGFQPHARIWIEVGIAPALKNKQGSGRIDLLWWNGGTYVAMEASIEPDTTADDEARSRLGTWEVNGGQIVIEKAISVQYPSGLREATDVEIAGTTFRTCFFTKQVEQGPRIVHGTRGLAKVMNNIALYGTW